MPNANPSLAPPRSRARRTRSRPRAAVVCSRALRGNRAFRGFALLAPAVLSAALAGCGGGGPRQDANEPAGEFTVEVVKHSFPARQRIASRANLTIQVRNADSEAVPNVAVTVDGLARRDAQPDLSDPTKPVWIIDHAPAGSVTAFTNTWALGRLAPGATRTFTWRVTAVRPGTHTVSYRVGAGLDGKAQARLDNGQAPEGSFTVRVSGAPARSTVGDNGEVVRAP